MKKIYIQPSIEFEAIEISDILTPQSQWKVGENDFTGNGGSGGGGGGTSIDTELGGAGSDEFAKQGNIDFSDDFAFQLDM